MFSKIFRTSALSAALFGAVVLAAPMHEEKRAGVTPVSASTIASFTRYTQFARAAYCTGGQATWNCGAACNANSDYVPYAGGGDSAATPYWFVGYSPTLASVVVGHQGTDPTEFLSVLNDLDVYQDRLDQTYFPGLSSTYYVHGGFQNTFKRSADAVLTAVKRVLAEKPTTKVTVIGHSLGGAVSILEGVSLRLRLPSVTVKTVVFGAPRVANPAFASYLVGKDITRINHDSDPIPIVPERGLFAHPDGEIHINADLTWSACAGQDNTDYRCSTGHVPNVLLGNMIDHLGSYNGVWLGGGVYC